MKVFYRKLDKYLLVLTFLCFLASCSSSKRIAYFQDLKPGESERQVIIPYSFIYG